MSLSAAGISQNAEKLQTLISDWHRKTKLPDAVPLSTRSSCGDSEKNNVVVALRTRPFLQEEVEAARNAGVENGPLRAELVRNPNMWLFVPTNKWNGVSITAKHVVADLAFGADDTNEQVFTSLIDEQDVLETALGGGVSCVLAYGQTGSGKTHTIASIQSQLSAVLFDRAAAFARERFPENPLVKEGREREIFRVEVQIWELLGKAGTDLLGEERKSVEVAEDGTGAIQISASLQQVQDPTSLSALISHALATRRTSPTQRNSTSSRSHLFVTLLLTNTLFPAVPPGKLVLVDLAGSERAADRSEHGKERMEESKAINESLMCLKECVVTRATFEGRKGKGRFLHIPYRSSKLTLALKSVFDIEATRQTKTIVIAHVSPHLSDAGHSNNTLTYVAPFRVSTSSSAPATNSKQNPSTWSNAAFRTWARRVCPEIDVEQLAPFQSGLQMANMSEREFVRKCAAALPNGSEEEAKRVYDALWRLVVQAKQDARPEATKVRHSPTDPEGWTHVEFQDWLESVAPNIRPDAVCRELWERGFTMVKLGEAEFVSRVMNAGKDGAAVSEQQGREVFKQMWDLIIAAKTGGRREVLAKREDITNARADVAMMESWLEERLRDPVAFEGGDGSEGLSTRLPNEY